MKIAVAILAVLALAAPATPQAMGNARWQRILTPPANNSTSEQCVVVDADLYAHAAPGLRDVRLMQDGQELPYAMDVSFDTRVGEAAPPPEDDRAQYDNVQRIPLHPTQPAETTGAGIVRDSAPTHDWMGEALLSAHVPVERVRLEPSPRSSATVELRASARIGLQEAETLRATLSPRSAAAAFTVGANLQEEAHLQIAVHEAERDQTTDAPRFIILEMRRREICYRPRTSSPVHLLLGDADALPARYDYALHFQPSATPLLAVMGPLSGNPGFRQTPAAKPMLRSSTGLRFAVTLVILLGSLAVTAFAVYELRRR